MSNNTVDVPKQELRLKNNKYELFDSSLACVAFILFQIVFDLIYKVVPTSIKGNLFGALLFSFLIEAIFGFAVLLVSKVRNVKFVEATDLNKKIDFKSGLLAVALSVICLTCFTGLTNTFVAFMDKLGYTQMVGNISIPNFGIFILYTFLIAICPAFFEELLFRGVVLNGIKSKGVHKAVIFSALIFTFMHGGPDQTIHQFLLGVVLGYAFVYSGSLWVPMIIHFVNNFSALFMLFISTLLTNSSAGAGDMVTASTETTWLQIGLSFIISLFSLVIGGALVFLCIKGLNALRKSREKKELEKKNTEEEKSEGTQQSLSVQVQVAEKQKKLTGYTVAMFVMAGAYLGLNWIITLISGFLL